MKKLQLSIHFLAFIILLAACNGKDAMYKYNAKITDIETDGSKRTLYVVTPHYLSETQLTDISRQLKIEQSRYDSLSIYYLLPGMDAGAESWAFANYNTALEIEIYDDSVFVLNKLLDVAETDALAKYNAKIVSAEAGAFSKMSITVELQEQITKSQIEEIATQLKGKYISFERLYIFYELPAKNSGYGAWATSHYTPDLQLKISVASKSVEEKLKSIKIPNSKIIGKWYVNWPSVAHSLIIYKVNGKLMLKTSYQDGSVSDQELKHAISYGKNRYEYKNEHSEYFMVEKDGRLGMYGSDGLFETAEIIK